MGEVETQENLKEKKKAYICKRRKFVGDIFIFYFLISVLWVLFYGLQAEGEKEGWEKIEYDENSWSYK